MSNNKFSKIFPDHPRGIGLSKQFLWSLIAGLLFLMGLFLYFLHHYQPKIRAATKSAVLINPTEAVSMIEDIRSKHDKKSPLVDHHLPQTKSIDSAFLKAASESSISVYHHANTHFHDNDFATPKSQLPGTGTSLQLPGSLHANTYKEQNQQSEKSQFLSSASEKLNSLIHSHAMSQKSVYILNAGTILPATLQTGINSDLPGTIIAKVRRDVFDSVTGNYLLVPQGSTLIGTYDSQVAYGQNRVLIAWSRLIFANGISQDLEGQQGVDLMGLAGLHDQVNNHFVRLFGSALMFSVFGAAAQLSQPHQNSANLSPQQIVAGAVGQQLSRTAAQMVAKNMNIQPTLDIRPGANFNVLLARDLILPGPYGGSK